jgi:molybdopterin-guanine dinucleotide biosynthesis protein A
VGAVLAGGGATRFGGRAKGLLEVGGRRIVDRVLEALAQATTEQIVVGKDVALLERELPGLRLVCDSTSEQSSLAGIHAALAAADGAALVVAWDMPFLAVPLLRAIRETGEKSAQAAIPEGQFGLEPLCAYYPPLAASIAGRQLARGELRLGAFVEALPGYTTVPLDVVSRFGDPAVLFANVNAPADLEAAEMRLANGERHASKYLHASSSTPERR